MEPKVFSSGKERSGRGFSHLELKKADIDFRMAKKLKLRVDGRRRTAYEDNIDFLKKEAAKEKKRLEKKAKKKAKKGKKSSTKSPSKATKKKSGSSETKKKEPSKTKKIEE